MKCKVCTKCRENKSLDQFHKRKLSKDGVRSVCKICVKTNGKHYVESKESKAEYYQKNYDRIKITHKNYWKKLSNSVYIRLGSHCIRCGFSDRRALQIDHINGNGNMERKKLTNYKFLKHLLEMKDDELLSNYQILCANCNQIKKIENKEFKKKN